MAETPRAEQAAALIASLPEDGCILVVHSHAVIGDFRSAIEQARGATVARSIRVIAAPSIADEHAATKGVDLPVFRDGFVEEQREHRRALRQAWRL